VDRVCLGVIFLILLKKQRRNAVMPRRRIGQETMFGANEKRSSLDEITALIDRGADRATA
jgi:preprotein translocase subunit SecG